MGRNFKKSSLRKEVHRAGATELAALEVRPDEELERYALRPPD